MRLLDILLWRPLFPGSSYKHRYPSTLLESGQAGVMHMAYVRSMFTVQQDINKYITLRTVTFNNIPRLSGFGKIVKEAPTGFNLFAP